MVEEDTDSLAEARGVGAVYTKDLNVSVEDKNDSTRLLPYSEVDKVVNTAVALCPSMVHLY